MKISEAMSLAKNMFLAKDIANPGLDALIILSFATSFSKEKIIFNPNLELNEIQEKVFLDSLQRRANYEPVSHIIGLREFYGADFFVNRDVLDPRPDSESLIELVIKNFADKDAKLEILELGVGSGCLIITLLKNYPLATGLAVDISLPALEICNKNAINNQVRNRLTLLNSDLFSQIKIKKFDLIISNPPYIPSREIISLQPEVRNHEPRIALDGGVDGLDFYRIIAKEAKSFLNSQGKIIVEIGYKQEQQVIDIFIKNNFINFDCTKDLSGITRILGFKCN